MNNSLYTKKQLEACNLLGDIMALYETEDAEVYARIIESLALSHKFILDVLEDSDKETDAYLKDMYKDIKILHRVKESLWVLS